MWQKSGTVPRRRPAGAGEPHDGSQQRRFPGAVRAQHRHQFPLADSEIDGMEGLDLAIAGAESFRLSIMPLLTA
jgi:hypothetical protein